MGEVVQVLPTIGMHRDTFDKVADTSICLRAAFYNACLKCQYGGISRRPYRVWQENPAMKGKKHG